MHKLGKMVREGDRVDIVECHYFTTDSRVGGDHGEYTANSSGGQIAKAIVNRREGEYVHVHGVRGRIPGPNNRTYFIKKVLRAPKTAPIVDATAALSAR